MPDDNITNLPILDDIITPGDADKAVQRPSRKVQSSLWDDVTDPAPAEPREEEKILADMDNHADTAGSDAEEQLSLDADDLADTAASPDADDAASLVQPLNLDSPAETIDNPHTLFTSDDIASLTDEIIAGMTPEIERLLREKIRQILAHRLSANDDSGHE
jgi:hypothetical protein